MSESVSESGQVFFTKHPILDHKKKLWGFELAMPRSTPDNLLDDRDYSAGILASSAFMGVQQAMERGKYIMLTFGAQSLLDKAPYAFSPKQCVIKLQAPLVPDDAFLEALTALKADGFILAAPGQAQIDRKILNLADIIVMDGTNGHGEGDLPQNARLLATRVSKGEQFEHLKSQGYTLFVGAFFKEAETFAERKLSSLEMSRLNILRIIEAEDPDATVLAEAIGADVSVSFRLLAYLNSAAFSFAQKIQSIKQAILILGLNNLKNWLRAVLLADMAKDGDTPRELVFLSLQRAKFLESVAKSYDYWGFNPDSLFMLGLFSLIDAILGMPMDKVLTYLPLEEKLKAALCRQPNNEFLPLMELTESLEEPGWPDVAGVAQRLSFDLETVKECYAQAMAWTGSFLSPQGGKA